MSQALVDSNVPTHLISSLKTGASAALVILVVITVCPCIAKSQDNRGFLLRDPAVSQSQIAFSYAGSLWIVSRDGGEAKRLTTGGHERYPAFSPDGSMVAFTGEYEGNPDVYLVSAAGGVPRRLTYHPGADVVVGWTPDGKRVLFRSSRAAFAFGVTQLFTVPI